MNNLTKKLCMTALFTALIAALSQIYIPTPFGVSLTLQTFAISLAAFLLGTKMSAAAAICYIALGAAGAPVFAGFSGGTGILFGPSGGFILAFPIFAAVLSRVFYVNRAQTKILLCFLALTLLYIVGITQFIFVSGNTAKTVLYAFAIYFGKDSLVLFAAYFLCGRIRKNILRFIQPK